MRKAILIPFYLFGFIFFCEADLQAGWRDAETGNYWSRARYYDSRMRGFISRDPAEDDTLGNLYAFVENNPGTYIDPYGLWKVIRKGGRRAEAIPDYDGESVAILADMIHLDVAEVKQWLKEGDGSKFKGQKKVQQGKRYSVPNTLPFFYGEDNKSLIGGAGVAFSKVQIGLMETKAKQAGLKVEVWDHTTRSASDIRSMDKKDWVGFSLAAHGTGGDVFWKSVNRHGIEGSERVTPNTFKGNFRYAWVNLYVCNAADAKSGRGINTTKFADLISSTGWIYNPSTLIHGLFVGGAEGANKIYSFFDHAGQERDRQNREYWRALDQALGLQDMDAP